jgi:hypothetical protein
MPPARANFSALPDGQLIYVSSADINHTQEEPMAWHHDPAFCAALGKQWMRLNADGKIRQGSANHLVH